MAQDLMPAPAAMHFFAGSPSFSLHDRSTRCERQMIRDIIHPGTIQAVRYNHIISDLIGESIEEPAAWHALVIYEIYRTIVTLRFPEKIFQHFITVHLLTVAIAESFTFLPHPDPLLYSTPKSYAP
jgi:hypothetical protein